MIRTQVIFTVFCLGVSLFASADNCDKDILTTCANVIEFMSKRQSVITGKEMIDDLCRFTKTSTICADNLTKECPQIKEKEQYKTLIRVNQKVETEVCEENSEIRKVYAEHENCLEKITESKALQCVQDFVVVIRLLDQSTDKEVCCTYLESKECIHKLVSSECGNDAANATVHVADLLATPLTEPRCPNFNVTMCVKESSSSRSNVNIFVLVFLFLFSSLF